MKQPRFTPIALICILLVSASHLAQAQFPPTMGDTSALDTMSGASTGPNPAAYINPANTAAATAAGANPYLYGGYGYGYGYGYGIGGIGMGAGAAVARTPTPTPIDTTKCLSGERVIDAVSGAILSDWRYIEVPVDEVEGNYFDNGVDGGDLVAEDGVVSNISSRSDVIGGETHQILVRLIRALESSEELSPLEFYRLNVLTTEFISEIGKWREVEADRDKKIREWAYDFVSVYKVDRNDDRSSEFYPLFVVPPPPPPSKYKVAAPVDQWKPPTSPEMMNQEDENSNNSGRSGGGGGYGYGGGYGGPGSGYGGY